MMKVKEAYSLIRPPLPVKRSHVDSGNERDAVARPVFVVHTVARMTKIEKTPTGPFNPFYGCAILVLIVVSFAGLVTWTIYSGYKQDKEISKFTLESAPPLPTPAPTAEETSALRTKLQAFSTDAKAGKEAELTLTVTELDTLLVLSGESGVADYRGIVRFTGLDRETSTILADICWPINPLPLPGRQKRFLVGQGSFLPVIEKESLDLRISTISVPGKQVNEGFLGSLQQWPWLNLAKVNAEVTEVLKKVTAFSVSTDEKSLILKSGPSVTPPTPDKG